VFTVSATTSIASAHSMPPDVTTSFIVR